MTTTAQKIAYLRRVISKVEEWQYHNLTEEIRATIQMLESEAYYERKRTAESAA